jgi:hypothetical protein
MLAFTIIEGNRPDDVSEELDEDEQPAGETDGSV